MSPPNNVVHLLDLCPVRPDLRYHDQTICRDEPMRATFLGPQCSDFKHAHVYIYIYVHFFTAVFGPGSLNRWYGSVYDSGM